MRMISCAAATLAAFSLVVAAQDTHTLSWNPVKGAKTKFLIEMTSEIDFGQGPMNMQANLTVENEVNEITDATVKMTGKMAKFELLVDGQDMSSMMPGGEEMSAPVTRMFSRKGALISSDAKSMMDNPRFEQLRVFTYPDGPVKIGDSWTNDSKGDKDKSIPPSRAKFTLDGVEDVNGKSAFRVKFAFSELEGSKPMGALGTAWVEKSSGELLKTDADINDASFAEGMPPMNFKMKIRQL